MIYSKQEMRDPIRRGQITRRWYNIRICRSLKCVDVEAPQVRGWLWSTGHRTNDAENLRHTDKPINGFGWGIMITIKSVFCQAEALFKSGTAPASNRESRSQENARDLRLGGSDDGGNGGGNRNGWENKRSTQEEETGAVLPRQSRKHRRLAPLVSYWPKQSGGVAIKPGYKDAVTPRVKGLGV